MEPVHIIAIAVALAMDAFAVAVTAGVILKEISLRQNFRLAWHFGLFQALMPIIGWGAGRYIHHTIGSRPSPIGWLLGFCSLWPKG